MLEMEIWYVLLSSSSGFGLKIPRGDRPLPIFWKTKGWYFIPEG